MAKLTYWYAERLDDADCYSVVARTKKDARAQVEERSYAEFGPIEKRVIYYKDAFDLFDQLTGESGGRGWGFVDDSIIRGNRG